MSWLIALAVSMTPYFNAMDHLESHGFALDTPPPVVWTVDNCTLDRSAWFDGGTIYLCRWRDWRTADWPLEIALRHEMTHAWQLQQYGPQFFDNMPEWLYEGHADWVTGGRDCTPVRPTTDEAYCEQFAEWLESQ